MLDPNRLVKRKRKGRKVVGGIDGISVTAEQVEGLVRSVIAEMADSLKGKDGEHGVNVPPEQVESLVLGVFDKLAPSLKGKDGNDGKAGSSVTLRDVRRMVTAVFFEAEPRLKGKDGIGKDGKDGKGVPPGGDTGQILAKRTDKDFDTEWVNKPPATIIPSMGGGGGEGPRGPRGETGAAGGLVPTFMSADQRFDIPSFFQCPLARPIVGSAGSIISGGEWSVLASVR